VAMIRRRLEAGQSKTEALLPVEGHETKHDEATEVLFPRCLPLRQSIRLFGILD